MSTFNVRNFCDQNNSHIIRNIAINSDLVYAEDLVILLAQENGINPIGRHLFCLYHPKNKIWLSDNEVLEKWKESKDFDFRLRFRPTDLNRLKVSQYLLIYCYLYAFNTSAFSHDLLTVIECFKPNFSWFKSLSNYELALEVFDILVNHLYKVTVHDIKYLF